MNPVKTREACINWLTIEDVEREAFAAVVAARSFAKGYAFLADADVPEGQDWPDAPDGSLGWLSPDNVLVDAVRIFSGRMQLLALSKGVPVSSGLGAELEGLAALEQRYGDCLKGEVRTITKADVDAMPPAQRKAFKAAIRTGKPTTVATGTAGAA